MNYYERKAREIIHEAQVASVQAMDEHMLIKTKLAVAGNPYGAEELREQVSLNMIDITDKAMERMKGLLKQ